MKIAKEFLVSLEACEDQILLFEHAFGDQPVEVNQENLMKASFAGLDVFWLIHQISYRDETFYRILKDLENEMHLRNRKHSELFNLQTKDFREQFEKDTQSFTEEFDKNFEFFSDQYDQGIISVSCFDDQSRCLKKTFNQQIKPFRTLMLDQIRPFRLKMEKEHERSYEILGQNKLQAFLKHFKETEE